MNGLNKSEQRAAEQAAAEREERESIQPLNPPFPYEAITFPFDFFGLTANPPEKES